MLSRSVLAACALLSMAGILIGCSTAEDDLAREQAKLPAAEQAQLPAPTVDRWAAFSETEPRMIDAGWLASFGDPRLSGLVSEALLNNRDLRVTAARQSEAEARARKAGANLLPTVDLSASPQASGGSDLVGIEKEFNLGLQVSWELDLWGRVSSETEAASLDAISAAADFEFARQSLAARIAESWFVITGNKLQVELDEEALTIEQRALDVVTARVEAGTVSNVDLRLARAATARAEEKLTQSRGNLDEAVRSLEVLLGRYPGAELQVVDKLTAFPGPVPAGLPSELLERRPDIVARDRQIAAAFNRSESARAARLPRVNLTASVTTLFNPASLAWSLAGDLLTPVFDGGRRQADVDISTAQQEGALADYASAALIAFQEVETALANEQILMQREEQLGTAASELSEAVRIEELRYSTGAIDIIRVNEVKRQFFEARNGLLRVQVERLKQRAKLHLALGGSFETSPSS